MPTWWRGGAKINQAQHVSQHKTTSNRTCSNRHHVDGFLPASGLVVFGGEVLKLWLPAAFTSLQ